MSQQHISLLRKDAKFRNSKGWLSAYAMACGYREAASHPTDKDCYIHLEAMGSGFVVTFRWGPAKREEYHYPLLKQARAKFAQLRKTIVVRQRLLQAGVL